jgi:hypothetical protein
VIAPPAAALLRALIVIALVVASSHADTVVELPKTKTTLVLDDAWKRVTTKEVTAAKDVVAAYKHDAGLVLAVTRADLPNPDAWVSDKKHAYADQIEKGIKAKLPGYKRVAKKLVDANGIPALDVEAKRDGGAIVVVRVLLFRTYALSLAIEVPKGGDVALARTIAKSFAPPKEPEPAKDPKPAKAP